MAEGGQEGEGGEKWGLKGEITVPKPINQATNDIPQLHPLPLARRSTRLLLLLVLDVVAQLLRTHGQQIKFCCQGALYLNCAIKVVIVYCFR